MRRDRYILIVLKLLFVLASCARQERTVPATGYEGWQVYGGSADFMHYSTLDQINRENVDQLKEAWRYDTGDGFEGSEMEASPIIIAGILYTTTPKLRVIALEGATGELRWEFDPFKGREIKRKIRNRGVTYWESEGSSGNGGRIFFTAEHFLYALDADTGRPVVEFGVDGRVDLRHGLGRDPSAVNIRATSPGIVYKDLIIMGSAVSEGLPSAPGDIRAYDCRTGELQWTFHTIPRPGEPGYDTWPEQAWKYTGGANNWAGMSLDRERGLVFAPTGSAAYDFYGANRHGDNLYANSLLALNADTGELKWHFQAIKHDVWDRDFPTPPTLVTVRKGRRLIDAVAQPTKSGHLFVFRRGSGKPVFPIEYREVPPSDIPGERLAETQPLPVKPEPFARQRFTEDLVTTRTPAARDSVQRRLRQLRSGGQFTPPSTEGTVIFPGFDGGAEWGGAAFDPATGVLYVNSNEMAWVLRLMKRAGDKSRISSRELYLNQCASCHRRNLEGTPPEFPDLTDLESIYNEESLSRLIREGSGRMPAFTNLSGQEIEALSGYLLHQENTMVEASQRLDSPLDLDYYMDGYNKFLDPEGYPVVKPPWGTLNALDLDTGEYLWQIPLGEYTKLAARGLTKTGSENYGGPVVTAGGVLFIGATIYDRKFRAFDKRTGELLWETTLPHAGTATPSTYQVDGCQYVVIAAGGGKWGAPAGGTYVAFALPAN